MKAAIITIWRRNAKTHFEPVPYFDGFGVIGAGLIIMLAFGVEKAPNAFLIWFRDALP